MRITCLRLAKSKVNEDEEKSSTLCGSEVENYSQILGIDQFVWVAGHQHYGDEGQTVTVSPQFRHFKLLYKHPPGWEAHDLLDLERVVHSAKQTIRTNLTNLHTSTPHV